jgi:fatty acid desaturase
MSTVPPAFSTASRSDEPSFFIDWPTLFLAIGVYAAFGIVTLHYHTMPWWLVLPLGATVVCLHGSLQHEATHGFPTRWEAVNSFIVGWPLWLWLPYLSYRWTHRTHHIDENLTNPELDPESNYLTAEQVVAMSPLRLLVRNMMRTLGGRMLFGPAYYCFFAWKEKVLAVRDRRWRALRPLLWHLPALAAILYWVLVVCDIPFWAYVAFFAYPGTSLTLVRSYAEHRAAGPVQQRTVICESNFFWSWLFLYNNLHLIHHRHPRLAWHQRPTKYHAEKAQLTPEHGYYRLSGYAEVFGKWFMHPKEPMVHPMELRVPEQRAAWSGADV